MAKVIPITEQFQHFVSELKESSGAICRARCSRVCGGYLSCCRSGNATCTW
jgi:hypothetical protein